MNPKQHGFLFKAEMIRAILGRQKWITRRLITRRNCRALDHAGKPIMLTSEEWSNLDWANAATESSCLHVYEKSGQGYSLHPIWRAGDVLWGRETWGTNSRWDDIKSSLLPHGEGIISPKLFYAADYEGQHVHPDRLDHWRSSLFMPRWASRVVTPIVSVRAERLQEISEADAIAEGITSLAGNSYIAPIKVAEPYDAVFSTAKLAYRALWNSINGPDSWDFNPAVFVIEFKPHQP